MAIPQFETFFGPVLAELALAGKLHKKEIAEKIKIQFGISDEEAEERVNSGERRFFMRVDWAISYLKAAGLVSRPERGWVEITPEGRDFLSRHPQGFEYDDLKVYPSFLEFIGGKKKEDNKGDSASLRNDEEVALSESSPEEQILSGYAQVERTLVMEILERLLRLSPKQFELVVLELIRKLGYGDPKDPLRHTGGPRDFGIDGIVYLDKLGLDKVYLQAKRYQADNKISSSPIHEFYGALRQRRANKGIFLTTSSYQSQAHEAAQSLSDVLVLIDGERIAELMIEHQLGVSYKDKSRAPILIRIPEIDEDYFEGLP